MPFCFCRHIAAKKALRQEPTGPASAHPRIRFLRKLRHPTILSHTVMMFLRLIL